MKYASRTLIRGPDPTCMAPAALRWVGHYARVSRESSPNGPASGAAMLVFTLVIAMLINLLIPFAGARAQQVQAGLMSNGDLAVTGFSGTKDIGGQTFIDPDGASLQIFDVSRRGEARGQLVNAPAKFEVLARDIGQVFGLALDNAPNPNIYATSGAQHGLKIVIPDNNGDGIPEVVQNGQPGATFMDGQFGATLGGGPGTVWRVDGTTGEISLFADITSVGVANSGPGLGNIAFDPAHYQFYVSDLDTGNIHRLDLSGNDLGSFDHGTQGRPQAGLAPVGDNPAERMDIASPAFDSVNPATWGLADERRRVWGLAYHSGRLYYAVVAGSQIWSVGINNDGSFSGDARVEIDAVPSGQPVSDILFTPQGRMIAAQRGGIQNSQDYSLYHLPSDNRVLRYSRDETGKWIQEADEYAIGFPVDHKNASGGVGLACEGTLWSTGDALRNDPAIAGTDPLVVHGLQGNDVSFVRPFNTPPRQSWFVDYDGQFADPEKAGHVGDVEVYRNCAGGRAESWPGWYPVPEWYPPEGWIPPVWWPREPDLDIEKYAQLCRYVPALVPTVECKYTIVITNNGAADFVGNLHVTDNPQSNALYSPPAGGSIPWTCNQPGGAGTVIDCVSDNVETLHPGESETLEITVLISNPSQQQPIRNCATIDDPFDYWSNEDCDESELPRPDLEIDKTFNFCWPDGGNRRCSFTVTFENKGGANYDGALSFEEHLPVGGIFGGIGFATTPGWGCIGGAPIKCTLPSPPGVHMHPGDVEAVTVEVIMPANVSGNYQNCVNLGLPVHAGDPVAPGKNEACAPFTLLQPIKHECPAGWQEVPPGGAPVGYQVIAIDGINPDGTGWGIMCMRPEPQLKVGDKKTPPVKHNCPAGWTKVPPQGAPNGWKVMALDGVNPDGSKWGIMCMKPNPQEQQPVVHHCPKGWTKVPPQGAPGGYQVMVLDGVNPDGTKWGISCMKPRLTNPLPRPRCLPYEKMFSIAGQVPKGWVSRAVSNGQVTIWCARPGIGPLPIPTCAKGEKQLSTPSAAPKGWKVRTVSSGGKTIWCAKPGSLVPVKPLCRGGKLVMLKTMPPRWSCLCPAGTELKGGSCKKKPSGSTGPQSTVPLGNTPEIKPCPRNWVRKKGKCYPPKLQINPNVGPILNKPLILKPQTRIPSLKKVPSKVVTPKKNNGKVMMFAPSTTLQRAAPNRTFR